MRPRLHRIEARMPYAIGVEYVPELSSGRLLDCLRLPCSSVMRSSMLGDRPRGQGI